MPSIYALRMRETTPPPGPDYDVQPTKRPIASAQRRMDRRCHPEQRAAPFPRSWEVCNRPYRVRFTVDLLDVVFVEK